MLKSPSWRPALTCVSLAVRFLLYEREKLNSLSQA
jgi:hypothetical protein